MTARPRLTPRRTPVQGRSRETVDAILEAAAQVFERHGYAAGTTNRIAERAGVSIGSLYQYFPNKDAILVALTERHMEQGAAHLLPLAVAFAQDPPGVRDGVERLVGAMVSLHADAPRLHRVLFEECPRPAALQARLEAASEQAVTAVGAWLSTCPDLVVRDVSLAAELVVQVVESVTHRLAIHPRDGRDAADYADETVELLVRYLTGAAGSRANGSADLL